MSNVWIIYKYIFNPTRNNYFRYGNCLYNNDKMIFALDNNPIKQKNTFKIVLIMVRNRLFKIDKVNLNVIWLFTKLNFGYISIKFICYVYKLFTRKELEY